MLEIDFFNKTKKHVAQAVFAPLLKKSETVLIKEKTIRHGQNLRIELSLVGESEIARLNKKHRGKNKPTDVISLSYFDKKMEDSFAGEIFICLPYADKQAEILRHSLVEELQFLFVHGLLHVFGYEHDTHAKLKNMQGITDKIMYNV